MKYARSSLNEALNKKPRIAYQWILKLTQYLSKADFNLFTEEFQNSYKELLDHYRYITAPALKSLMVTEQDAALKNTSFTHHQHGFDQRTYILSIVINNNVSLTAEDLSHLKIGSHPFEFKDNRITVKNAFIHPVDSIRKFLTNIDQFINDKTLSLNRLSLQEPSTEASTTNVMSQDISSAGSSSASSSSTSSSTAMSDDETRVKGPKIKTRGTPYPAPEGDQHRLEQPQGLMAKALGFHIKGEDVPVYELSGPTVPAGIHYAYGIHLNKRDRSITDLQLQHYQELLEEDES